MDAEKNLINFDPVKVLLRLAAVVADQQGIQAPRIEITRLTQEEEAREA